MCLRRHAWSGLGLALAALPAAASPLVVTVSDSRGQPLPGAVVAVYVKGERATAAPGTTVQIAQRERQFQPRLTVMQTGTAALFPNFDTVRHHVYSFSPVQRFEIRLYAGVPASPLVFDKPGVATLGCNIHDRMSAHVVIVDTPHFGDTGADGSTTLDMPPGTHRLRAWHPALTETGAWLEQPVTVDAAGGRAAIKLPVGAAATPG